MILKNFIFYFFFWNLEKKYIADVLICVRVKLDKIWAQYIESKKKFLRKKVFFSAFFFSSKKNFDQKNVFFENNFFFDSMHWIQILSNFAPTHIKTSVSNFFIRFQKQNSKTKSKIKFLRVKNVFGGTDSLRAKNYSFFFFSILFFFFIF